MSGSVKSPAIGRGNKAGYRPEGNKYNHGRGFYKSRSNWNNFHNWRGRGRGYSNNKDFQTKNHAGSQASSSQQDIRIMLPPPDCPYKGWHLYMREAYRKELESIPLIEAFEEYFRRNPCLLKDVEEKPAFQLNMQKVLDDVVIQDHIPNLREKIYHSPQKMINIVGLAAHQTISKTLERSLIQDAKEFLTTDNEVPSEDLLQSFIPSAPLPLINPRFTNFSKCMTLKNLKASYYGKFITVKGTVVRVSSIKPLCKQMAFLCLGCKFVQGIIQQEGKYTVPSSCPQDECQSRSFVPDRSHPVTQTVDCQSIKLQEIINDDQREGGRVPRSIHCELMEDLVDTCIPGDIITLSGIVKVNQNEETKGNKAEKSLFLLYIDANSIINSKTGSEAAASSGIEFSIQDYYAIEKIQSEEELFKLLVASLCPAICGHEMVKAGLILCLFGGCSKNESGGVPVRGEPHILVVGDPGLGKSQMLQACSNVAPRGVYVCGNTTTTSGLTVTLTRESGGDFALEGGALVLADQGICCIDEFDKMTTQHQALLEAMEQQNISLAKAGIVCSLPARTSILAAANPVGGHYNKAKTVSENIKMSSPLLSRFDLVFILLDKPDEELDSLLSEHVMSKHIGGRTSQRSQNWTPSSRVTREDLMNTSAPRNEEERPLSERLKYSSVDEVDFIPHQLIRKYICYARKYVRPRLSEDAAKVIQSFYLELREKLHNSDSTPITTRQLESLIRLSEARARCELREEVTESDAKDVVEIMKFSMIDTYSDEFGFLDFQRSQHGSGTSNRSQMKKFIAALQKVSESTYKSLFSVDEMRQLSKQINLQVRDFQDFISTLNHQGYLLKKASKVYQLLTAD